VKNEIWLDGRFLIANFRDSRIFAKYPWLSNTFDLGVANFFSSYRLHHCRSKQIIFHFLDSGRQKSGNSQNCTAVESRTTSTKKSHFSNWCQKTRTCVLGKTQPPLLHAVLRSRNTSCSSFLFYNFDYLAGAFNENLPAENLSDDMIARGMSAIGVV
jgi:hypothetical protein